MQQKQIEVRGASIRMLVGGQGPALILLPSAAGRASEYQGIFPLLEKNFQVFAVDYPGFGLSDELPEMLNISDFADFILDWMDTLSLQHAHITGFSMGGWIALSIALSAPSRLNRLILVASSGGLLPSVPLLNPSGMSFKEILDHFYYQPEVKKRMLQQKRTRLEKRAIYRSHRAFSRLMKEGGLLPNYHHRLNEIQAPALILGAEQDCAIPLPYQEKLHEGLPDSEFCVFPETGHAIVAERPRELAEKITRFLQ